MGYVRDLLLAWRYGSSWIADSFFVALLLPSFFGNLLGAALKDAVVPYLQASRFRGVEFLYRRIKQIQLAVWSGGIGVAVIIALGAPLWLALLVPGWDGEKVQEFMWVFQLSSALILVQTVLYFQTAIFNVNGYFILPMTRTVWLNVGAILALLYTETNMGIIIASMLAGEAFLLCVMQYKLRSLLVEHPVPSSNELLSPKQPTFSELLVPFLLVAALQQICIVVERILGTYMAEGSITQLSYAFRIVTIPLTLFSFSILALLYPRLSLIWLERASDRFSQILHHAVSVTLFFLVPASVVLCMAAYEITVFLLQRGAFGPEQVQMTSSLLAVYGIGLPAMGLALLAGRALVAIHKGWVFAGITALCSLFIVCFDLSVYQEYGPMGLAIGNVVGISLQAFLSLLPIVLSVPTFKPWVSILRWAGASLLVYYALSFVTPIDGWMNLLLIGVMAFVACLVLVFALGERHIFELKMWRTVLGQHRKE